MKSWRRRRAPELTGRRMKRRAVFCFWSIDDHLPALSLEIHPEAINGPVLRPYLPCCRWCRPYRHSCANARVAAGRTRPRFFLRVFGQHPARVRPRAFMYRQYKQVVHNTKRRALTGN